MKLVELIGSLKSIDKAELLISKELPNVEFDLVELYLENALDINSGVKFFNAETIPNELLIEVEGIQYINLFPLYFTQQMVEEYVNLGNEKLTDLEIAQRILGYRIKDA